MNVLSDGFCEGGILFFCALEHATLNGVVRIEQFGEVTWVGLRASPHRYGSAELQSPSQHLVADTRPDRGFLEHLDNPLWPVKPKPKSVSRSKRPWRVSVAN